MLRTLIIILLLMINVSFASDSKFTFQVVAEKSLPHQLGIFKELQFVSADPEQRIIHIYVVKLANTYHARIYQQPQTNQLFAKYIAQLGEQENFMIAINGGYYTPEFQPAGLLILQGKHLNPWAKNALISACIKINKNGKMSIGKNKLDCVNSWSALQAGPLLINNTTVHSRFTVNPSTRLADFLNENDRTVVAVSTQDDFLMMVTSDAKLAEIATILKNYPDAFNVRQIQTAINLDGGSSTGMFIRFSPLFYVHEIKPVKTFLFFN